MNRLPGTTELRQLLANPDAFSPLDLHFAMFIARIARNHSSAASLAAALISRTTGSGNICLNLAEHAGQPLLLPGTGIDNASFICPPLDDWIDQLLASGVAGEAEGNTPLVLAGRGRLYLRRYWQYEKDISRFIRERAAPLLQDIDLAKLGAGLKRFFPTTRPDETDWQQIAALAAVTRSFTVISGGPGTGKTSTAAKILALLRHQHRGTGQLRIQLAAPTGKAAARLQQAILASGLVQPGPEPLQAATLHRMLGHVPNSPYFRHNAENPLAADVVIIDEASMVDLPLLAKLMQAVPAGTRLILLGDRHQLASVQPGAVLGDICRTEMMAGFTPEFRYLAAELTGNNLLPHAPARVSFTPESLPDSFVELARNYRFSPESSIARLSQAVRLGQGESALELACRADDGSIAWSEITDPIELPVKLHATASISRFIARPPATDPGTWFSRLDNFRILCALRSGPFGMTRINRLLEQKVRQQWFWTGHDSPVGEEAAGMVEMLPYRPVMVTRNDYNLQLFNGDVGLILPDPEDSLLMRAYFRDEYGTLREIAPLLLPPHETVFAMTVHKSQGSEFNKVLLILPDRDSPLLTRELLYTAITRARENVTIWGSRAVFLAAVKRQIARTSGLAEDLWGEES